MRSWLVEGGRAFASALGLALVALLVILALRPAGTAWYARGLRAAGPRLAALALGHQAAALPNHAMFILAPALGSCDRLAGAAGTADVLCLRTIPAFPHDDAGPWFLGAVSALSDGRGSVPVRTAPWPMWFIVLAPGIAVSRAGQRMGRGAPGPRDALLRAAGAAAVFASLAGIGAWAAGLTVVGSQVVRLGPRPWLTAELALLWGLIGMGSGAAAASRPRSRDQEPAVG
jgi:hypothetical protein